MAFLEGACSVLEGHDIFGGRLKCFGGAWHFEGCLQCFGGAWHFGEAACSVLEGACSVLEGACSVLEGHGKSTVFYMRLPVICSHSQIKYIINIIIIYKQ